MRRELQRQMARRVAHRYLMAARKLFWHGTSSKYLRRILKQGLIPNPKELQYTKEVSGDAGRSIRTFGGIYLTDNWQVAFGHAGDASRKQGGNRLMVMATIETRSPKAWADEDDLLGVVETTLQLGTVGDLTEARSFWGQQFRYHNLVDYWMPGGFKPSTWGQVVEVIQTADVSEAAVRFWEILLRRFPRLRSRYEKQGARLDALVGEVFRSYAMHMLQNSVATHSAELQAKWEDYLSGVERWDATQEEKETSRKRYLLEIALLKSPPPEIAESFSRLQRATDALSAAIPEVTDPSAEWSFRHNIRLQVPLTYRGKNRILAVVEQVGRESSLDQGRYTDIHFWYGPASVVGPYLEKYQEFDGGSYRALYKGRVLEHHQSPFSKLWPEDIWGPKP